jgi:hypothetical protein
MQWSDLSIEDAEGMGATVGPLIGVGRTGDAGVEAGARAGMEAGSDGHVIDDSEAWDLSDYLPVGSAAAIALIEHLRAEPLHDALRPRHPDHLLGRMPIQASRSYVRRVAALARQTK